MCVVATYFLRRMEDRTFWLLLTFLNLIFDNILNNQVRPFILLGEGILELQCINEKTYSLFEAYLLLCLNYISNEYF